MSTWKAVERALALRLGGRRVPVSGRTRGDNPDIDHARLSLEIKHRKRAPAFLVDAMDQAVKSIKSDDQLPTVIVHQSGSRHDNDFVVLRLKDFENLIEGAKEVEGG